MYGLTNFTKCESAQFSVQHKYSYKSTNQEIYLFYIYDNTFCCFKRVVVIFTWHEFNLVQFKYNHYYGLEFKPLTWEGTFDEVFKQLQVIVLYLSLNMNFCQQGVATAKLALQVLRTPEALELTVDHHCQPGTQGLTLLHAGEGKYHVYKVSASVSCFFMYAPYIIFYFNIQW